MAEHRIQEAAGIVVRGRSDLKSSLRSERGEIYQFVEDPVRNAFFRLGRAEFAFFQALDGRRSIDEAVACAARHDGRDALNLEQGLALAKWLVDAGLATTTSSLTTARFERAQSALAQRRQRRFNPLFLQFRCASPDRLLDRLAGVGQALFSRTFFAAWSATMIAAAVVLVSQWSAISTGSPIHLGWRGIVDGFLIWCALKIVHETAHGLACRRYGGSVGSAGLSIVLGIPSPFVDVSSVWRIADRRRRIVVSLAGVYVELFVAAVALLLWSWTDDVAIKQQALAAAFIGGVSSLIFNLNPLMRFDGYFALADAVDVTNLYSRAREAAWRTLRNFALGLTSADADAASVREPAWLSAYGLASMAWRTFVVVGLVSLALYKFGWMISGLLIAYPATVWLRRIMESLRCRRTTSPNFNARRAWRNWAAAAAVVAAAFLAYDPRTIALPAVVEYEPTTIVRAPADGFVDEIYAADGDFVEQGRPLVRMRNESLALEIAQAKLVVHQHLAKMRVYRQEASIAKEQAELRMKDAAEEKLQKLLRQEQALLVCAPSAGRIASRSLSQLVGRWLDEGAEIVSLGNESDKHVLIAVPHDLREVAGVDHGSRTLSCRGSNESYAVGEMKVDPSASVHMFHAALSVDNGGDVPVRHRETSQTSPTHQTTTAEFYEPQFRITGKLDAETARRIHAGRTGTVSFQLSWRSAAARFWRTFENWLDGGSGGTTADS